VQGKGREVMPIERDFGEIGFRRLQQWCERHGKKLITCIVAPIGKVTKVIERREVNIDIVLI
jgi:hypothetical protein